MKKDMMIGVGAGVAGGVLLTMLLSIIINKTEDVIETTVSLALPEVKELDANYLAKVDDYGISVSDFTNAFQTAYDQLVKTAPPQQLANIQSNESLLRAEVLNNIISQYAVVATAIKEGFLEDPANKKLLQNALQQALYQLYISENLPKDTNQFKASNAELDQAYAQYGQELRARGMNVRQSREYLQSQIAQQKQQQWLLVFVTQLREGYRIERNDEAIKANDISTTPNPQLLQ